MPPSNLPIPDVSWLDSNYTAALVFYRGRIFSMALGPMLKWELKHHDELRCCTEKLEDMLVWLKAGMPTADSTKKGRP